MTHEQLFAGHGMPRDMASIKGLLRADVSRKKKQWKEEPITPSEIENAIDGVASH